jgi:hypothetical protein
VYKHKLLDSVSRTWRRCNTEHAAGMGKLTIFVDANTCPLSPDGADPMDEFMAYASRFMTELGGAIPFILNNRLDNQSEDWRKRLETDARKRTTLEELSVLRDVPIYLYGDPRPTHLGPVKIDCDCSWTLASDGAFACELQRPDTARAYLLIYIGELGDLSEGLKSVTVKQILEKRERWSRDQWTAQLLLGRSRAFVHALVDGMWSRQRLLEKQGSLVWSRNELRDWCVDVSQFIPEIGTVPVVESGATPGKRLCAHSCDAGRAWEHSLTRGAAFFQDNLTVVSAERGDEGLWFTCNALKRTPALVLEVLERPERLIDIVRGSAGLAEEEGSTRTPERYVALPGRVTLHHAGCHGGPRGAIGVKS